MTLRRNYLACSKPAMEAEVEELTTTVIKHGDDPFPTEDDPAVIPDGEEIPHEVSPEEPDIMGPEIISEDPVTNVTQAYENVAGIVTEAFDEGGLSMEAAQILNLFSHHLDVPVMARVSTESYGTTAMFESRIALEGAKEVIAAWYAKLKEWLQTARNYIEDWAGQLVVKLSELKSKGEALKEKTNNAQPGSGNIEFPKAHLMKIDGEMVNVPQAYTALVNFAETAYVNAIDVGFENAKRVGGILGSFQLSGQQSLNQLVNDLASNANAPAEAYGHLLTNRVTDGTIFEKLLAGNEKLNAYVLSSDKFLGNAQLVAGIISVVRSENPVEDLKNFGKAIKFSELKLFDESTGNKWSASSRGDDDQADSTSVPRISPSDAGNIADSLIKMAGILEKNKDILQKKKDADKAVDAAAQAVNNLGINEQVESGEAIASALRGLVSSMSAQVQSPTITVTMWLVQMSNAVGQYASLSLAGEAQPETQTAGAQ